jgi:hypothetical protein
MVPVDGYDIPSQETAFKLLITESLYSRSVATILLEGAGTLGQLFGCSSDRKRLLGLARSGEGNHIQK